MALCGHLDQYKTNMDRAVNQYIIGQPKGCQEIKEAIITRSVKHPRPLTFNAIIFICPKQSNNQTNSQTKTCHLYDMI